MSHAKFFAFLACLLVCAALLVYLFYELTPISSSIVNLEDAETVVVGEQKVRVEIVDTPEERAQGLSGKSGLAPDEGMLFVFPKEEIRGFWMKDMLFSIDILWISSRGEVVGIEKSVSPESYPSVFRSPSPVRYVLELSGGFSDEHGLEIGSAVNIE